MKTKLLYLFTRTPLHVGAGSSVGAIDQPIQRERHTGHPIIPGSSLKGVLADQYQATDEEGRLITDNSRDATRRTGDGARLFGLGAGKDDQDNGQAGSISFGEARLLAFPVRSAKGCFVWLTSPLLLQRWGRNVGLNLAVPDLKRDDKAYFAAGTLGETIGGNSNPSALFEDYVFHHAGELEISAIMSEQTSSDPVWTHLVKQHLALVSDEVLSHFTQSNCEVAQHVVIDDETGTAKEGLLFNQENVPAETLFFSTLHSHSQEDLDQLKVPNPVQVGGGATTGLGFCTTNLVSGS